MLRIYYANDVKQPSLLHMGDRADYTQMARMVAFTAKSFPRRKKFGSLLRRMQDEMEIGGKLVLRGLGQQRYLVLNTDDAAHLFLGVEWAATLGRGPGWSKIKKQLCDNDEGLAVFPLPGSLQLEGKHAWRSFFWGDPRHPSGKALKKSKKSKKPA